MRERNRSTGKWIKRQEVGLWEHCIVLINPLKRAFAFQMLYDLSMLIRSSKKIKHT
jgi:hypothetical protein